jgi:hypothetical protein
LTITLGGYKWFTLWSSAGLFSALSLNIFGAAELGYDYDIYFAQRRKGAKFQILNLSISYLSSATPYFYCSLCGIPLYLIYAVFMCNHTTISVIALQAVDETQQ